MIKEKRWSLGRWKKEARKVFQKWVRLRDADSNGFIQCCSCGEKMHWKDANGGHFIPAEHLATCFDERNCHAQCPRCNTWLHGNLINYFVFMERRYGREVIDDLQQKKNKQIKLKFFDYQEIIETYTDKIKGLE